MSRLSIFGCLAPALGIVLLLFVGGLSAGVLRSLNFMPVIGLLEPNLDAFSGLLSSPDFYISTALTLHIAFTSTLISSLLAIAAALLLRRSFAGRKVIGFLFQLNLTIPHLVGAIGILYLFSQSGALARIAAASGAIAGPGEFPALIFDPYAIGIILQYVWKEVPFIGIILLANMQVIGEDYESVARTLGANRWQSFRYVLLPLLMPGLLPASAIVFAFSFGAYEVPAILGASFPEALPVMAYRKFSEVDLTSRPESMAIAIVIAVISAIMILLYTRWSRRRFSG